MIVWISLYLLICSSAFILYGFKVKKRDSIFLFISIFAIVLIFGSRDATLEYGSDLNNYYRMFQNSKNLDWNNYFSLYKNIEIGYLFFNKIISFNFVPDQFIIYFVGLITNLVVAYMISKQSRNFFLSIIIYLSLGTFSFYLTGFRQSLAISFGILSFISMTNKKYLLSIFLFLFSISLHYTAIIILPFLILMNIKNRKIVILFVLLIFMLINIFLPTIISVSNSLFNTNYDLGQKGSLLGPIINIILFIFVFLIKIVFQKNYSFSKKNKLIMSSYEMLFFVGALFYSIQLRAHIFERISFYFLPFIIIVIPEVIHFIKSTKVRRIIEFLLFAIFSTLFFTRFISLFSNYQFFF